jgi:DNA modification methylase
MEALGTSLTYVWLGWARKRAPYSHIDELAIRSKGRPLLCYAKGEYAPEMPFDDVPARTDEAVIAYYVEILTERGDLVVDPFSGGTTAVVARKLGRRFASVLD